MTPIIKPCAYCGKQPYETDDELALKEYWCVNTECSEYEMPFDFDDWQAPRFYEEEIKRLKLRTQETIVKNKAALEALEELREWLGLEKGEGNLNDKVNLSLIETIKAALELK